MLPVGQCKMSCNAVSLGRTRYRMSADLASDSLGLKLLVRKGAVSKYTNNRLTGLAAVLCC
jgi:hypothetical protein